jgi:hypothetical protein
MIARLAVELHCYIPEELDETWAHLHLVADELGDLQRIRAQLRAVEADMVAVLDELGLARLADIPALRASRISPGSSAARPCCVGESPGTTSTSPVQASP